jgi:iron(III) transport system ATP-binding protein
VARLSVERAVKRFGDVAAVNGVTLELEDGEFLCVLGPSGCGKTTLLRLIAGFERLTSGTIGLAGAVVSSADRHVAPEDRRIGVVFQSYALWPHMTVGENVGYPLRVAGVAGEARARRVGEALATVGLSGFEARRPAELSGGQRQRVALARCLVMDPQLVLLDEPLANLDTHLRAAMQREFAEFHRRSGKAMIYITHDQAEAMALATRIAVMDEGRLVQLAEPSRLYREPASRMVAGFIGQTSIVPGAVLDGRADGRARVRLFGHEVVLRAAATQRPTPAASICLRPEDMRVAAIGSAGFPARVRRITYRGGTFALEAVPEGAGEDVVLRLIVPETQRPDADARIAIDVRDGWIIPQE